MHIPFPLTGKCYPLQTQVPPPPAKTAWRPLCTPTSIPASSSANEDSPVSQRMLQQALDVALQPLINQLDTQRNELTAYKEMLAAQGDTLAAHREILHDLLLPVALAFAARVLQRLKGQYSPSRMKRFVRFPQGKQDPQLHSEVANMLRSPALSERVVAFCSATSTAAEQLQPQYYLEDLCLAAEERKERRELVHDLTDEGLSATYLELDRAGYRTLFAGNPSLVATISHWRLLVSA
ncbi:hypothetical protein DUNSADRAFT_11984 [Dunaliella salina]|uniref:Uncharacterized protein n=1 Tax=Dunaliella salina TaxID=3046 RepID=A0ABQ7GC65_DUNSA|nr:hypothetical protein DUNSADRAFT_11984 [Dunaliella salina]|eukprot:KAF5832200.1 hypothetical protein DUNSADRAFT_11984 [Dunaliella salina]